MSALIPFPVSSPLFNFSVIPSFHHLILHDNSPVEEVYRYLMLVRHREDKERTLLNQILNTTQCTTVGDLRRLTDLQWKSFDLPAIVKIYLKYIVRQTQKAKNEAQPANSSNNPLRHSSSINQFDPLVQLQNDFNSGLPFDFSQYSSHLNDLSSMGFTQAQALEALLITENRGLEAALNLLIQPPSTFKARRDSALLKLGKSAKVNGNAGVNPAELHSLKQALTDERIARANAEAEVKNHLNQLQRSIYREFLRGITADESITPTAYEQLRLYREQHNINNTEHAAVLSELNLSAERFEKMKHFDVAPEKECIVCQDQAKDHIILNCMHICLCADCAVKLNNGKSKCPMCDKKISSIVKVFF
jgi:ferredoxin